MKPKHLLTITCVFLLFSFQTIAQTWDWAVNAGGNHQDSDAARDIAVDSSGNQFIAGYFTNKLTLGAFTLENPSNYYADMYLAKLDSRGNVLWAKTIELGDSYKQKIAICLDDQSNVYITGTKNNLIFYVSTI